MVIIIRVAIKLSLNYGLKNLKNTNDCNDFPISTNISSLVIINL